MKKQLLIFLVFLPLLLLGDSKTYNKQFVIHLWDKELKEITEIKKAFDEVADKYGLEVQIQNMTENDLKWRVEWKKFNGKEKENK